MSDWDELLQERIMSLSESQKRALVIQIDGLDTPSPRGIAAKDFVDIVESLQMPPALVEQLESAMNNNGGQAERNSE